MKRKNLIKALEENVMMKRKYLKKPRFIKYTYIRLKK